MKIPKTFLHCKKNIRSFKRYYPTVISLTFSAKFVLEYKVQNIAFWRIDKILLFEELNMLPLATSLLLWLSNSTAWKALEILKIAQIVNCKGCGPSDEMKIENYVQFWYLFEIYLPSKILSLKLFDHLWWTETTLKKCLRYFMR